MWLDKFYSWRKVSVAIFILWGIVAAWYIPRLSYDFSFEQFFPQGDDDLEFFRDFVNEFESDDNFLLIAIENPEGVFEPEFLKKLKNFSTDARLLPGVRSVQSLALFRYPVMTPFGPTTISAVHPDDAKRLKSDSILLMQDERVLYHLVNESASSTAVVLKTKAGLGLEDSRKFMNATDSLVMHYGFENFHFLGRPYFQTVLSQTQLREINVSTIISVILVSIIMIFIYRKWISFAIALGSIGLGLVLFLGLLAMLGQELTLMSALYPILMLIVGTSDVIHIMTKYFDELEKGLEKRPALLKTIRQIGLTTLLTSLTTAVGFATLLSSRIAPIREFGINSSMGVVLAYLVVIGFTCPMLSFFSRNQLVPQNQKESKWPSMLEKLYLFVKTNTKPILVSFFIFLALAGWGISLIHTNYSIGNNLPRGHKITEDFLYFEKEYAGFRPLEIAGNPGTAYEIFDYEVMKSVDDLHNYVKSHNEIQTVFSIATLAKSLNQMNNANQPHAYTMPDSNEYRKIKNLLSRTRVPGTEMLINSNKRKTRISARVKDVGSDSIAAMSRDIDNWIVRNIDPDVITFRQTGSGLLLDKNSEFVRQSLTTGLGIALLIVSLLMALLFRNIKMTLIALIPNVIPLLFAAALLGFTNEALEAGVAIVFAIIFGIAVDDTIHFLSKYKLAMDELNDREAALKVCYMEAGKAIIFTSIILFFGFLVLLFSVNPPSMTIGILISVTLVSAVVADLFLLPVLIRKL